MTIYLDFDGTVVEHEYPGIGVLNKGCMEVVIKLQNAGHAVILNSYRANLDDKLMVAAHDLVDKLLTDNGAYKIPRTIKKIKPPAFSLDDSEVVFIDDECVGIPLKRSRFSVVPHHIVDFEKMDVMLGNAGLYGN